MMNTYSKQQTEKSNPHSNRIAAVSFAVNSLGMTNSNSTLEDVSLKNVVSTLTVETILKLSVDAKKEL